MFSSVPDTSLPSDINGMIPRGGYPELYVAELASNTSARESIRTAIEAGMPYLAECGGFLYLHGELEPPGGSNYPMIEVIDGDSCRMKRLFRFGYASPTPKTEEHHLSNEIRGHGLHYWDSTDCGEDWIVQKPLSTRTWGCVHGEEFWIAEFPHLYYPSNLDFLRT